MQNHCSLLTAAHKSQNLLPEKRGTHYHTTHTILPHIGPDPNIRFQHIIFYKSYTFARLFLQGMTIWFGSIYECQAGLTIRLLNSNVV